MQQTYTFDGLTLYRIAAPAGAVFNSPPELTGRCLGVFYNAGSMTMRHGDADVPSTPVGIYTPWALRGVSLDCMLGPDGADWFCLSCDDPGAKTAEQVDASVGYTLPAQTQAVLLTGSVDAGGALFNAPCDLRFAVDTQITGTGALVVVR